jgi:hypothetical protein
MAMPIDPLLEARELSLAALQSDASKAELQEAAKVLGGELFATAENGDLWDRLEELSTAGAHGANLSEEERAQLDVIVRIDWARLLNEAGYRPPPPATGEALRLQQGIARALHGGGRAELAATRERLASLGMELMRLAGDEYVSRKQLRRALRKGLIVSTKVLVTVGLILGTAAVTTAVGVALPAVAPFVIQIAVGLVADAAGKGLDKALSAALEGGDVPDHLPDPATVQALESGRRIGGREGEAFELVAQWRAYAGDRAPEELLIVTRRYFESVQSGFYGAWETASLARWFWALQDTFDEVNAERWRLCEELAKAPNADPIEVADRLERFQIGLDRLAGTYLERLLPAVERDNDLEEDDQPE